MKVIILSAIGSMLVAGLAFTAAAEEEKTAAEPQEKTAEANPSEFAKTLNHGSLEVYVDVKPECPRRGCWAVTCEALHRMEGVKWVDLGKGQSALLRVTMAEKGLPDPAKWEKQFREYVGTSSDFRGVVISLTGTIDEEENGLMVDAEDADEVRLLLGGRELLLSGMGRKSAKPMRVKATGTLKNTDDGYAIEVRELSVVTDDNKKAAKGEGTRPSY